jgi:predicted nucleic acid-binding protein
MADKKPLLYYWDSVVFIDLIEETPARIHRLRPIIDAAQAGKVVIVTSAFTMAEVVKVKNLNLLDEQAEKTVTEFFENPYISIRNVDRFISERARPIVRFFNVKPPDAIHIATALLMEVQTFHTFDGDVLRHNGKIDGLRIEVPPEPVP